MASRSDRNQNKDPKFDDDAYDKSARELFYSIDKDGDNCIGVNELMNYLTGEVF